MHRRTDGEGKDRERNMTKCMGSLTFLYSYINVNGLYHTVVNVVAISKRMYKLSCLSHAIFKT